MRKISQIQYKKVDADIKPFRKTVLSIIDDHMYLIQSYKYDQNLDVWLNSKVTSFLTVEFITGTADVTWSSDKSIGDVVSDNQDDTNYVGEDQTYHCTLVRSDGKTGDVIGVKAQLVQ